MVKHHPDLGVERLRNTPRGPAPQACDTGYSCIHQGLRSWHVRSLTSVRSELADDHNEPLANQNRVPTIH